MNAPAIGSFVRPVGLMRFAYCYRIDMVLPPDAEHDAWYVGGTRFGLTNDNEPVADGHQSHPSTFIVPALLSGIWRDPNPTWRGCPRYWVDMGPRGQLEMFH